jgi:hypothetical protein
MIQDPSSAIKSEVAAAQWRGKRIAAYIQTGKIEICR